MGPGGPAASRIKHEGKAKYAHLYDDNTTTKLMRREYRRQNGSSSDSGSQWSLSRFGVSDNGKGKRREAEKAGEEKVEASEI